MTKRGGALKGQKGLALVYRGTSKVPLAASRSIPMRYRITRNDLNDIVHSSDSNSGAHGGRSNPLNDPSNQFDQAAEDILLKEYNARVKNKNPINAPTYYNALSTSAAPIILDLLGYATELRGVIDRMHLHISNQNAFKTLNSEFIHALDNNNTVPTLAQQNLNGTLAQIQMVITTWRQFLSSFSTDLDIQAGQIPEVIKVLRSAPPGAGSTIFHAQGTGVVGDGFRVGRLNKLQKGSAAAKVHMARLRAMRRK